MKNVLLFGLGCATGVGLAVGLFLVYHQRSASAHEWNTAAIQAKFDGIAGDDRGVEFWYIIRNNTAFDYTLDDGVPHKLMLYSRRRLLIAVPEEFRQLVGVDLPLYIPTKREVRYSVIHFKASVSARNNESPEAWAKSKLKPLDGFALFDQREHYEIVLPRGNW